MDPLSLAISIAGLAGVAATVVQLAKNYMANVKNAKGSVQTLVTELEALQSNLSSLDGFLRSLSAKDLTFQNTSVLWSCASACETKLNALCEKLGKVGDSKRSRYLWPLNKKEHQKTIQELRAFGQWIQFALSVDGCSLLSQTSADVLQVLEHQVESFRILQMIEYENCQLKEAVRDQTRMMQDDSDSKTREQVLNWISTLDHDQKHYAVRLPRVQGTGTWLLDKPEYVRWRDGLTASNVLWCHGDPGTGKSVLTSIVIDQLKSLATAQHLVAFIYFDYQDEEQQTPASMLSSVLRQLVAGMSEVPKGVSDAYKKRHDLGSALPVNELESLLLDVTATVQRVYIIIDAFDECDASRYRKPFVLFLDRLKQSKVVRLFVTSRSHLQDINASFQGCPQIEIQAHDSDLRRYMQQELFHNGVNDIIDDAFTTEIIEAVLSNANGMFLLPILQLRTVLKEPTIGEMEDALKTLSSNLPEAFEQTITRIQRLPESRRRLGTNALMWVCHSRRPLSVFELSDALAVRPYQAVVRPKLRPSPSVIIECCQGLVSIDPESKSIRLSHKAIQDYLLIHGGKLFQNADSNIAATCFTYLLLEPFKQGPLSDPHDISTQIVANPLLHYASRWAAVHAYQVQKDESVQRLTLAFLASRGAVSWANQVYQFTQGRREEYWDPEECRSVTALHIACRFGLEIIVRELLSLHTFPVDVATKIGTTPLIAAASGGHVSTLRLLLNNGANVYAENWYGNALHCAAEAGHSDAVRELVSWGMSPNLCKEYRHSPLDCTIDHDHFQTFETLVELGAEIESRGEWKKYSALHSAVKSASIGIVDKILQNKLADVNSRSPTGLTALHFAARNNNAEVLQRLLEAGADITAEDDLGRRPLDIAIKRKNNNIIRLLGSSAALVFQDDHDIQL